MQYLIYNCNQEKQKKFHKNSFYGLWLNSRPEYVPKASRCQCIPYRYISDIDVFRDVLKTSSGHYFAEWAALFFPVRHIIYFYYYHYCYPVPLFIVNVFNMILDVTWIFREKIYFLFLDRPKKRSRVSRIYEDLTSWLCKVF